MPVNEITVAALWKRAHRENVGRNSEKGTCQGCGRKNVELSVHHTRNDYGRSGKQKLEKLCRSCHNSRRKGTKYKK